MKFLIILFLFSQTPEDQNRRCLLCHGKKDFGIMEKGEFKSLYVSYKDLKQSVHHKFTCVTCHDDVRVIPHLIKPRKIHCLQCHFEGNVIGAPVREMPEKYKESVHARAKKEKGKKAPDCYDCHGIHNVRGPEDTLSTVYKENIPETCGQCHKKERDGYENSVHYKGLKEGVFESAVCTDCHREHDILPPEDPRSTLNPRNVVHTCEKCHADVKIMKKTGVPVKQVEAFKESFHGIALEFGVLKAANCTSCHGYHEILPSTDPRSPINPANLAKTCGKCHPNASQNVAKGKIHVIPGEKEAGIVYYVYTFFKIFTFAVILGLIIHIILDLIGRFRRKEIAGE